MFLLISTPVIGLGMVGAAAVVAGWPVNGLTAGLLLIIGVQAATNLFLNRMLNELGQLVGSMAEAMGAMAFELQGRRGESPAEFVARVRRERGEKPADTA